MTVVRRAGESDAVEAIEVVRRSISQLCVADHRNDEATLAAWLANKTPRDFLAWLANTDNFCIVAQSDSRLSGVGVLNRKGEILLFYLEPGAQRQGIGKKIHAALENQARQWGLASLHLESTALARPFYEALGYRPTGPAAARFGVMQTFPYAKQLKPQ
jgi:GNAT superfamily N-acetyltransferase